MYKDIKIVVGIATMDSRKSSLQKVLSSLSNQTVKVDEIIVYNNDENEFNATDNGKFYYFTKQHNEDVIFFSCDDDIYYPKDYVESMCIKLEKYNYETIVTHHGRILKAQDVSYYSGHTFISCLHLNPIEATIDIPGTGVTAFHTSYFKPDIFYSEHKRMSDVLFGYQAFKENKKITILKHKNAWLKDMCDDLENSCHTIAVQNQSIHIKLCNEIYNSKYNPLVSIIIPYNKDRGYLDQAFKSVENQTYKNIELIESFSEKSVGYNLNNGISRSNGYYIKYLCDDDMLTVNSISDSIMGFKNNDNDFIHGNSKIMYMQRKLANSNFIPSIKNPTLNDMLIQNRIHGGTLMYKKEVFDKYGLFDESLWTGEEYEMSLRLLHKGAKLGYVNSFLYIYRRHNEQKSLGNTNIEYQKLRQIEIKKIKNKYR